MIIRRIFAGAIVTLLVSVAPLGAACDLTCAFAQMGSDCHSAETSTQGSASSSMKMDGMDMGMNAMPMPDTANSDSAGSISGLALSAASHPSIGEMGPCERQTCNGGSARFVRSGPANSRPIHSLLASTANPRVANTGPSFRDAPDDVAAYRPRNDAPLTLSLRV